ncbi:hypothetical protein EGW08_022591, partial [Elysia chlorotica]
ICKEFSDFLSLPLRWPSSGKSSQGGLKVLFLEFKSAKTQKWKRQKKAEKKKNQPSKEMNIEDVHLYSDDKLKNKIRNPQNNIKISGKKKRRLTKRLGHSLRERSQMQVDVDNNQRKQKQEADDTEMVEEQVDSEVTAPAKASSSKGSGSSSTPASAGSGKKRRGRKKNKKTEEITKGGSKFEENDGWGDVEMAE